MVDSQQDPDAAKKKKNPATFVFVFSSSAVTLCQVVQLMMVYFVLKQKSDICALSSTVDEYCVNIYRGLTSSTTRAIEYYMIQFPYLKAII